MVNANPLLLLRRAYATATQTLLRWSAGSTPLLCRVYAATTIRNILKYYGLNDQAASSRTHRPTYKPLDPDYQYPVLYKDHVFTSLTENGQKLFYPPDIHPSCVAKRGQCIKRVKCVEKKMLYISRICYARDLVCCYTELEMYPFVEQSTKYPIVLPNLDRGPVQSEVPPTSDSQNKGKP